jgi:hypothetical protein
MRTIVVSGALANKPFNGGEAWVRLSWVRGFQRLGFRVVLVEQIAPDACVDAAGAPAPFGRSENLWYFRSVVEWAGLCGSAALVCGGGEACEGLAWPELVEAAASAELLVNVSGHLALEPLFERFRKTAYVDIDPGYTQFWHADGTSPLRPHDHYFTIGENIGSLDCPIPTGGMPWQPIRQPVVLEDWTANIPAPDARALSAGSRRVRFTTVANWRGPFGRAEFGGKTYGLKLHEFRKCFDLPRRAAGSTFELALDIHPSEVNDLAALRENHWRLTHPKKAAATPEAFREFVRGSDAEFSVAQGIYVETRSGWFSDRTTRYLAAGRPALVQDTGFSRTLPCGEGLVPFTNVDEAAAGAERIARDYESHCAAARAVAEQCFDARVVLKRMLETAGVGI